MAWPTDPRPAKALVALRQQVIALAPGRSTSSEGAGLYGGMLASSEHHAANPTSDHEPNSDGVVRATDITNDPRHGMASRVLAQQILDSRDERIKYIISDREIASGTDQSHDAWVWRPYSLADTGDPHTDHCHISLKGVAAFYDDPRPWKISAQTADPAAPPAAVAKPVLKHGSIGIDVSFVQQMLLVDGVFGPITENAVKHFQETHGLTVDGIVGAHTWAALLQTVKPPVTPLTPFGAQVAAIAELAAKSALARHAWVGRGTAPLGYVKGMAVAFAMCLDNLKRGDAATIQMAKANTGNDEKDALSWYNSNFAKLGLNNVDAGAGTLLNLFVLLIGLGMRESSGKHCEGRDMSANNTSASTAEAGLFQMSWDAHGASPFIPELLTKYQKGSDPTAKIFAEGVTCSAASWSNSGIGTGAAYQQLCKNCPGLAVETAAVGLRVLRKHWGPINRKEAELRPEAVDLLRQVQRLMDTPSSPDTVAAQAASAPALATLAPTLETAPVAAPAASVSLLQPTEAVAIPPPPATSPVESTLNMNDASAALLRYALIAGFTGLAVYGYVDPKAVPGMVDNVLPAVSAIGSGLTMLWGVYISAKTKRVPLETALRADVPTVNALTGATQPGSQFTK